MFLHGEIFEFSEFFFCLKIRVNVNAKATVRHNPCFHLLDGGYYALYVYSLLLQRRGILITRMTLNCLLCL